MVYGGLYAVGVRRNFLGTVLGAVLVTIDNAPGRLAGREKGDCRPI